jgi:hypothetical protein
MRKRTRDAAASDIAGALELDAKFAELGLGLFDAMVGLSPSARTFTGF